MKKLLFTLTLALALVGCDFIDLSDDPDPNGPDLEDVLANPTPARIANLATGIEANARDELNTYYVDVSMIGREAWRFSAADPRFTSDLLGKGTAILDDNTFYITRPWRERYQTIRNINILLDALESNRSLAPGDQLSEAGRSATAGYAKTMMAYQLLQNLNLVYNNGIRIDVAGTEPGPVVGRAQALDRIAGILNEAASELQAGGSGAFPFPLSSGFAGFNTPATFLRFNRALAARVGVYRGDWGSVLNEILPGSFISDQAPLTRGVYHIFSIAPGDMINSFFFNPDAPAGDALVAHPSYVADLEDGDNRISKVFDRTEPATVDGLTSDWGFFVYKSAVDAIPIIRNAELILIRAEAQINLGNLAAGVQDLNVIRNAAGLADYSGAVTQEALLDEMLRQRRYELFGEGHRWIDMRRYGRLDQLPIDRPEDDVWQQFPIPGTENV